MKKCRGCGWAHYCSSKCQEEHWRPSATRRGHKAECDLIAVAYDHARRREGDLRSTPAVRSSCGIVSLYTWAVWRHVFATMYPGEGDDSRRPGLPRPSSPLRDEMRRAELRRIAAPVALRPTTAAPIEGAAPIEVARRIALLRRIEGAAPRPSSPARAELRRIEGAARRIGAPR